MKMNGLTSFCSGMAAAGAFFLIGLLCRAGDKSKVAIPMEHPPKTDGKNHAERGAERPFGRLFCHRFWGVFHGYGNFALISRSAQ